MTIYAPHKVDAGSRKYRAIRAEMSSMGAPVIRAVDGGDCYYAIEGLISYVYDSREAAYEFDF